MESGETFRHWQLRSILCVFLPLLVLACLGRTYLTHILWWREVVVREMKRLATPIADSTGQLRNDGNQTLQLPSIDDALQTSQLTTTFGVPIIRAIPSTQQPSPMSSSPFPATTSIMPSATTNPTSTPVPASATELSNDMAGLFLLADDQSLPRGNTKCPPEVRVSEWNGRIGNHYFQVSQAIVAALFCHITRVRFPPHINTGYQQQDGLLDMPQELILPGVDGHEDLKVPNSCPEHMSQKWHHQHCQMVPAWHHQQVMAKFLRPYLGQTLTGLVTVPRASADDGVLTIHLRSDDIGRYPKYLWAQPPCSMYQKIISDIGYKTLMIVAKDKHAACDSWLVDYGHVHGINVSRPRDVTVAGDLATLIRAKNLVLSFSSFSLASALLSKDLQVMYRRRDAKWYSILHAIVNCNVWTGVTLYEYNTSLQEERKGSPSEWLKTFPLDQITGPFTCQYGSDIKPEI